MKVHSCSMKFFWYMYFIRCTYSNTMLYRLTHLLHNSMGASHYCVYKNTLSQLLLLNAFVCKEFSLHMHVHVHVHVPLISIVLRAVEEVQMKMRMYIDISYQNIALHTVLHRKRPKTTFFNIPCIYSVMVLYVVVGHCLTFGGHFPLRHWHYLVNKSISLIGKMATKR